MGNDVEIEERTTVRYTGHYISLPNQSTASLIISTAHENPSRESLQRIPLTNSPSHMTHTAYHSRNSQQSVYLNIF